MKMSFVRATLYLAFAAIIVSLFVAPRLPFQDYPDWIYQAKAFKEVLSGNPKYLAEYSIRAPVIPNSATTIIMGLLNFLVSPDLAGRIVTAITLLLLFLGFRRVFRQPQVDKTLADAMAAFFAPSIFFFYGYLAFNFGLAFYLLLIPKPIQHIRNWLGLFLYTMIFLILYYSHFIVLAMGVATILLLRITNKSEDYPTLRQLMISLIPVIILFSIYYLSYSKELGAQNIWYYSLTGKLGAYFHSLAVFYRFNDFQSNLEMSIILALNLIVIFGFWALLLFMVKGDYRAFLMNKYATIGFGLVLLAIPMPYKIMGFGFKGDRLFWLGVIFLSAAAMSVSKRLSIRDINIVALASAIILLTRASFIVVQGQDDKKFEKAIGAVIPSQDSFYYLMTKYDYPEYYPQQSGARKILLRLCPYVITYHRVPFYIYIDRNIICPDIFATGVLRTAREKCDIKSIIFENKEPANEKCRNLLFVSPDGFSDSLFADLKGRFQIQAQGRGFIYAKYVGDRSSEAN